MAEDAKCRYHSQCGLYQLEILGSDVQIDMCGEGERINGGYVPLIPLRGQFKESLQERKVCDSFSGYLRAETEETIA